jgi:hypothetical protein
MSSNKQSVTENLREEFISKINQEWQSKWAAHGESFVFSKLKSQNAFLDDLSDDIEKVLKAQIGLEETSKILISKDNLRRILTQTSPTAWQEKTRKTLSYYVGYDGWKDFKEKHHLEEISPVLDNSERLSNKVLKQTPKDSLQQIPQKKQSFYRKKYFTITTLSLISIAFGIYYWSNSTVPENFTFKISSNYLKNCPAQLYIEYDLSKLNYKKAVIKVEKEVLQYIPQPTTIDVVEPIKRIPLHFFTPGMRIICLEIDGKIVSKQNCIISSGDEWYGCARIKTSNIPDPLEDQYVKEWFGLANESNENTPTNFITHPTIWNNYINRTKKKVTYPNEQLHFPENELKTVEKSNSRIAFVKADRFKIDIDSCAISFKVKRPYLQGEDCMSFMLQLFDDSNHRFELYTSSTCTIDKGVEIATVSYAPIKIIKPGTMKTKKLLTGILEDGLWHDFQIIHKNGFISLHIDNELFLNQKYTVNYSRLTEIWFVFENNGYIDDVVVSNSLSKQTIFSDNFSAK